MRRERPARLAGIDHVLVGVRDLDAARRTYAHLGFTLSPRGVHIGWGTANVCAMLEGGYIELLGIVDPDQFTNNLDRFLVQREGLLGLALASDDAVALAADLRSRGIAAEDPKTLKRTLEAPGGTVEPEFTLVHLPPGTIPGGPAFVCQHRTPDLVWQAPWLTHANGARALVSVTAVVEDPGAATLACAPVFGADAVMAGLGTVEVETGRGRLRFTSPEGLARLYPGLAAVPRFAPPWLAGLRVAVDDIGRTAAYLAHAGVAAFHDGGTVLRLAPEAACGVMLEFAAAGCGA
ncbi:MAG: VOC family protein [Alphaproteobacteria bacterium]|nr:MAG: VOC family protein [Alphaproteobacteria bacterium]